MIIIMSVFWCLWLGFNLIPSKVFVTLVSQLNTTYFCFYLIFFLYEIEDVPGKVLSLVKTAIGAPGKWFVFVILMFIVPASLSFSLPFISVET